MFSIVSARVLGLLGADAGSLDLDHLDAHVKVAALAQVDGVSDGLDRDSISRTMVADEPCDRNGFSTVCSISRRRRLSRGFAGLFLISIWATLGTRGRRAIRLARILAA